MKAIKLIDAMGNTYYINGNESELINCKRSLLKVVLLTEVSGGKFYRTHFFTSSGAMNKWCFENNKKTITRGQLCCGLKMGYSGKSKLYDITA